MEEPIQDAITKQMRSIKIGVWIIAICTMLSTVALLVCVAVYSKALTRYEGSLSRPKYQETMNTLLRNGKWDEALKVARQRQATDPEDAHAWYTSGLAYYHMNDWTNALHDLTEAQRINPTWEQHYTGPYIKTLKEMLSSGSNTVNRTP